MTRARVVLHYEDGSWWAESPDLEGFTVVAPTLRELQLAVRDAVAFHLESEEPVQIAESMAGARSAEEVAWVSRTGGSAYKPIESRAPHARISLKASA